MSTDDGECVKNPSWLLGGRLQWACHYSEMNLFSGFWMLRTLHHSQRALNTDDVSSQVYDERPRGHLLMTCRCPHTTDRLRVHLMVMAWPGSHLDCAVQDGGVAGADSRLRQAGRYPGADISAAAAAASHCRALPAPPLCCAQHSGPGESRGTTNLPDSQSWDGIPATTAADSWQACKACKLGMQQPSSLLCPCSSNRAGLRNGCGQSELLIAALGLQEPWRPSQPGIPPCW